jgi:hypothetical protein
MVKDLGFSEAVYGFGAAIAYLGYMLFEIPSTLFLERIGACKTFARITILWGITSNFHSDHRHHRRSYVRVDTTIERFPAN